MPGNWYVMQSKPNREEALYTELIARDIEVFFPRIRVNPVNPRARKIKAYFPGYMFVKVDLDKVGLSFLQYMPFAKGMVSFEREPAAVPEGLLQAIRHRLEDVNRAGGEEFTGLEKGTRVYIHDGPFAGYEGIFDLRLPGTERVRVLIELLSRRYMPVELQVGTLRKAEVKKKK
jgi:transcription antitermination factor NusG